jgi:hypothetical protein
MKTIEETIVNPVMHSQAGIRKRGELVRRGDPNRPKRGSVAREEHSHRGDNHGFKKRYRTGDLRDRKLGQKAGENLIGLMSTDCV